MLSKDIKDNKTTIPSKTVLIDNPTLCVCGCGETVNPLYDQIKVLREQRMTFSEIGKHLEIDGKYAQVLHRTPPKYKRGHVGKTTIWITKICKACGKEFRTSNKTNREYCVNNRKCPGYSELWGPRHRQFIKNLDNREKERKKTYKKIVVAERRLWTLEDERIEQNKRRERRTIEKRQQRELREIAHFEKREENKRIRAEQRQHERWQREARREMQKAIHTGKPLSWHIQDRSKKLLTAEQRRELNDLLYEQTMELKRGNYGWGERPKGSQSAGFTKSLDIPFSDDSFSTMGDLLTSRMDFTSNKYIENIMTNNGINSNGRIILTHGKRH